MEFNSHQFCELWIHSTLYKTQEIVEFAIAKDGIFRDIHFYSSFVILAILQPIILVYEFFFIQYDVCYLIRTQVDVQTKLFTKQKWTWDCSEKITRQIQKFNSHV